MLLADQREVRRPRFLGEPVPAASRRAAVVHRDGEPILLQRLEQARARIRLLLLELRAEPHAAPSDHGPAREQEHPTRAEQIASIHRHGGIPVEKSAVLLIFQQSAVFVKNGPATHPPTRRRRVGGLRGSP